LNDKIKEIIEKLDLNNKLKPVLLNINKIKSLINEKIEPYKIIIKRVFFSVLFFIFSVFVISQVVSISKRIYNSIQDKRKLEKLENYKLLKEQNKADTIINNILFEHIKEEKSYLEGDWLFFRKNKDEWDFEDINRFELNDKDIDNFSKIENKNEELIKKIIDSIP